MSEPAQPARKAWQPVTPSGVARFATASVNRILVAQTAVALIAAASIVWFLANCYAPVLASAIQELPDTGKIVNGHLQGLESASLSENRFLSLGIESDLSGAAGVGDVQVRFSTRVMQVCSLFGCFEWGYPGATTIPLSRSVLEPAWGAWKPMVYAAIGLFIVLGLISTWWLFAILYFPLPKLVAFYADRELSWKGSYKLACVAQIPAALMVAFIVLLYGVNAFDLLRFLGFYFLHLPISWAFLVSTPFFLPKLLKEVPGTNPFTGQNPPTEGGVDA